MAGHGEIGPHFEPSGAIDKTFETKFTVLARKMVAEETS